MKVKNPLYSNYSITENKKEIFLDDFDILHSNNRFDLSSYELRSKYVNKYSWFAMTDSNITILKNLLKNDNVLEIGSGSGALASILKSEGINIIPTVSDLDNQVYKCDGFNYINDREVFDLDHLIEIYKNSDSEIKSGQDLHAEFAFNKSKLPIKIKKLAKKNKNILNLIFNDTLLFSWPPYATDAGYKALLLFLANPYMTKFVYIGENYGGCNASDDFFEMLTHMEKKDILNISTINIDKFPSLYDDILVITKKKASKFIKRKTKNSHKNYVTIRRNKAGLLSYYNIKEELHREDGPAIYRKNNSRTDIEKYLKYGVFHRKDGPAEITDNRKLYYIYGELLYDDIGKIWVNLYKKFIDNKDRVFLEDTFKNKKKLLDIF